MADELEPLDVDVVFEATDAAPMPWAAQAHVTMRPQGTECWWRLYSTPTSPMRSRQDHLVRAVSVNPRNEHVLTLEIDGYGLFELSALGWRVNPPQDALPNPHMGRADDGSQNMAVDSLDLLVAFPPTLPGPARHWQQMTTPGQLAHPGNSRARWCNPADTPWWQGGHGVRFEDGYSFNEAKAQLVLRAEQDDECTLCDKEIEP